MLVYGDRTGRADPRQFVDRLVCQAKTLERMAPGTDRHSGLVALLIEAGRLLQGIADEAFSRRQEDRRTATCDALTAYLVELAHAVIASRAGTLAGQSIPSAPGLSTTPEVVELREPEGFAFYAVYPEAYADAAARLQLLARPRVIGIRSIGTSLGAMVAAAIGASTFFTVRPFGDPFARQIAVAPELEAQLLEGEAHFIVVDEGPGQSGSSFGAVADWLERRGVPLDHIAFLPSHGGGPGNEASNEHRTRWRRSQRSAADGDFFLPELAQQAAEDVLGPLDGPVTEISGGAWRAHVYSSEAEWPPVNLVTERRKFLARGGGETWLLKFGGLGGIAERKLKIASAMNALGLVPEPRGSAHGFLVERWHVDGKRLSAADRPLARIATYLGARARLFPVADEEGASVDALFEMVRRNAGLALGNDISGPLDHWRPRLKSLAARVAPVRTDNKLDPHEWLRMPDGRLLKTDAVDHHAAHDLVGAQDVAWDVAGASVEFSLDSPEASWLAAEVGRNAGRLVDPDLLQFMTVAYLAFRLGQASLGRDSAAAGSAERRRLEAQTARYAARLGRLLQCSSYRKPRESALGRYAERAAPGTILP